MSPRPTARCPTTRQPSTSTDLSVERRVLCAITNELYSERLGARNTLPAIAAFLLNDPNTTSPPPPNARLNIQGLTLEQQVQLILDHLNRLITAGLILRDGNINNPAHTYHLTDSGIAELQT